MARRDARDLGEELFSGLMHSNPLVPTSHSHADDVSHGRDTYGDDYDDDDEDDAQTFDTAITGISAAVAAATQRHESYRDGISAEFFRDLVATPVDHLTGRSASAAADRPRSKKAAAAATAAGGGALTGDVDLNVEHLNEALELQRRTTQLLHEVERTSPPQQQSLVVPSQAQLRNEDYLSPDYEYQSAAAMNLRRASQQAMHAANAVQQQAVVTLEAQVCERCGCVFA